MEIMGKSAGCVCVQTDESAVTCCCFVCVFVVVCVCEFLWRDMNPE